MLQFTVALYCLAVVSGLTFGVSAIDSPVALFTLIALSAVALLSLAPQLARFLVGLICFEYQGPARPQPRLTPASRPVTGAPGTGAASPRAPSAAFTLA